MTRRVPRRARRSDDPNRLALALDALWVQRTQLKIRSYQMTEHRLLVLLLACERPIGAADLAGFVRRVYELPRFAKFQRLRHPTAAYRQLYDLHRAGLLQRAKCTNPVRFRLPRRLKRRIRLVLLADDG